MTDPKHRPSAAALVIGNELLTGKIREANVEVLAKELFALGIELERVVFCADEVETIAAELQALTARHDWVFSSGGVGPTHDDVTLEAVAKACGRPLERSPEIEGLLRGFYGDRINEDHLRMADVPAGAKLLTALGSPWPLVLVEKIFVLPGLPEVFRYKMPILRLHLQGGRPFFTRVLATHAEEGDIAAPLRRVAEAFPALRIGSYPRGIEPGARVTISFEGQEESLVESAVAALHAALPGDVLLALPSRGLPSSGD